MNEHYPSYRPGPRWLAWCGVVPPLLDLAVIWTAGVMQSDYSHTAQFISELGETGRRYSSFVSAWWFAFTFAFAPFAVAVYRQTPANSYRWAAALALLTFALFSGVGSWLFPCDPGCTGATFSGRMHLLVNCIGTGGLVAAPACLWWSTRGMPPWKEFSRLSLATHLLLIASLAVLSYAHYGTNPPAARLQTLQGLLQRLFLLLFYVWVIALAFRLMKHDLLETSSTAPSNQVQSGSRPKPTALPSNDGR